MMARTAGEESDRVPGRMEIETIAVGGPRTVSWQGKEVVTSIFKAPVPGPVVARGHNLEGDRQSDLQVHGGEHKAVYAYAAEHYAFWRERLERDLEPASFGENLTIRGLVEPDLCIGDVVRIGEGAELEATLPRLPCFKLGLRFGDPRMVKTFAECGRWGIYFRIAREGRVAVGDAVTVVHRHPARLPVYDVARVYFDRDDPKTMRLLAAHDRLDPAWRSWFLERLAGRDGVRR